MDFIVAKYHLTPKTNLKSFWWMISPKKKFKFSLPMDLWERRDEPVWCRVTGRRCLFSSSRIELVVAPDKMHVGRFFAAARSYSSKGEKILLLKAIYNNRLYKCKIEKLDGQWTVEIDEKGAALGVENFPNITYRLMPKIHNELKSKKDIVLTVEYFK